MTEKVAKDSLEPGDHGTTYGGNPLVCTAVEKTIEIFEKEQIVRHVQEVGAYLEEKLEELVQSCEGALERRGRGLIQGLKVSRPAGEICQAALKEGLLVISARSDVVRLVPPLVIEKEHVDELAEKLRKVL